MEPYTTVKPAYHGLELPCAGLSLSDDGPLTPEGEKRLAEWAKRYQALTRPERGSDLYDLLLLGQELYGWLNGPAQSCRTAARSGPWALTTSRS